MSISGSTKTVGAGELDIWRSKKAGSAAQEPSKELASQVSQISGHSVHEIDHLIAGLQGVREKLNNDGDRIHREIQEHAAFSRSIIELTGIINDALASVNKPAIAAWPPKDAA
jgi:hypothetical protein